MLLLAAPTLQAQEVLLSHYNNNLQKLVDAAQAKNAVAVVDKNVTITKTVTIHGNITLTGKNGAILHNAVTDNSNTMLWLGNGSHNISNITITQHANGKAFQTTVESGALWTNNFDAVNIQNGRAAYESSRGGTANNWCITTWTNSNIRVAAIAISVFSQDGPFKALHLRHMNIANGKAYGNHRIEGNNNPDYVSHTLYCHPNVSLDFDSVILDAGTLTMHHFSSGGVPGENKYVKLHKVTAVHGSFEMVTPEKGAIIITESDLGPYTILGVKHPLVEASHTNFKNMGNGIMLRGKLTNCTGGAWTSPDGPLEIIDSKLDELSFRAGGSATVRRSTVAYVLAGDRDHPFEGKFYDCSIGVLQASKAIGKFYVDGKSTISKTDLPQQVLQKMKP